MSDAHWLLALDTSTDWAGIALTDGEAMAELNWTAGRKQTTHVMPEVERLLGTLGLTAAHLGAVAVATGPGSFSGLRVGLAIASGLSIATGIPVLGVSTIELTVHGWRDVPGLSVGAVRAGRSRYGWASADEIDVAPDRDDRRAGRVRAGQGCVDLCSASYRKRMRSGSGS